MDTAALTAFAGVVVAMVIVPGPDFMFMLTSGVHHRAVRQPVTGVVIGHLLLVSTLTAGVGPLVSSAPGVLDALTLIGAAFLCYLGIGVLRTAKTTELSVGDNISNAQAGKLVRQGIGVAVLNPKALLFYLVVVPQFASPEAPWAMPAQFAVLGGMFVIGCLLVYVPVGLLAGKVIASRPRASQIISYLAGAIMIALGLALAVEFFWS
ncbi:MAG: LysE family translocator [Yaniella sp.]|uniref:LysE family translocator n=1 Tax=Yaniella sp. TaxID=2773929 RepID=UPI0026486CCB|nr:LysE family translocator [Yaniella sp.]MDN5731647.1 LysE family translocator [Yaniella sp.]MDN5743151.1 LysE family translocator [Yaniella sp.]MDN5817410.1 LysE family translocator [Yaniella sp.]MDN5838612.1 LysE family translocator [Yaniella sp.]MDN5889072.1 LysE family translocator [Yaniella sp.]